jgi:uncharacterized protein (TIGR02246 family)
MGLTLSCAENTYQVPSKLLKLTLLFLLALLFVVAGVAAQSSPEEAVSGLMAAWNAKDAQAFASGFSEDGTFVNVNGSLWIGRYVIGDRHANAGIFKSSRAEIKPEGIRLITSEVALMHVSWTITGDARDPQPRSYLMTMVVRKRDGQWRIVAAQNGSAVDRSSLPGTKFLPDRPLPPIVPDSEGVRKLFSELDISLSGSDAASLAKLFAEDSDLVDTSTHRFHGRANIEEHFADVLAHSLKGTNSRTNVLTSNSLSPDLAVLEARWELKGGAQGGTPLTITGLRLVSRKDGSWQIEVAQDTIARTLPPQNAK